MIDNKYKIIRDLGAGATAEVKLVEDINTMKQLAVKIMKNGKTNKITKKLLADVQKEVTIAFDIKHENIIKVRAVGRGIYDQQNGQTPYEIVYIVMDFAQEGELFDMILQTGKFSEKIARYYFHQILNALDYMHNTVGICHRDLKPENILLDENFNILFSDFGFSVPLSGQNNTGKLTSFKGTLSYMTPEQLAKRSYSGKAADLFSTAVVLFLMMTQCQPFEQAKVDDKYYRLIAGNKLENYWKVFDKVAEMSDELKELLSDMMSFDPTARLTMDEIIAHPWVQGPVPTQEEVFAEMTCRKQALKHTRKETTTSTY